MEKIDRDIQDVRADIRELRDEISDERKMTEARVLGLTTRLGRNEKKIAALKVKTSAIGLISGAIGSGGWELALEAFKKHWFG